MGKEAWGGSGAKEEGAVEVKTSVIFSRPADKPKIAFHATMMAIQNFGFFIMYYDIWGATPGPIMATTPVTDPCGSTRYAVGMMALTCFGVAFLCIGMWFTHASLYMVYVGGMLSITWFSFLKNVLPKKKLPHPGVMMAAAIVFIVPQSIVYATL